jgi:predicted DsbA family dithiol-disulfide isomerase
VRVVYKNFPLRSHKQANLAALYALAAGNQGMYNEMHKKIMSRYTELKNNQDLPLELAAELGLNIDQLKVDIKDPSLQDQINLEVNELRGTKLRLAVPKFLVNGEETSLKAIQQKISGILFNPN